ncbi:hypothetical protein KVV02_006776 [Mortierella alpina]|uniref:Swi5-dependent recombination DNA repair protein 1 n=1 Tax=Mortierella alpina TaxID=64518 RepID=A0A9P8A710_MORAP|nr:hypothetical protein KVV02_006776 [Mortierella alpina]
MHSHSLSAAISMPTQNDLIPADQGRTCNKELLPDHDNTVSNSTSEATLSSNEMGRFLQSELSGPSATTSTVKGSLSLEHPATAKSQSSSHPVSTSARTISGTKRRREEAAVKRSLHKPFKSPIRSLGQGTTSPPMKQMRVTKAGSASESSGAGSSVSVATITTASQPLIHSPELAASVVKSSKPRTPTEGKRVQFRSPFAREPTGQPSGGTALARLMQLQALNSRATELQSTVRKAKQVIQLQQKRHDTPLVELIEKWKRASQEGAQVLFETCITQEQVLGSWGDDTGWSRSRQPSIYVGDEAGRSQSSHCLAGMDRERLDKHHEAEEARLEIQDVQQDLPTVDEAIRSRSWPDVGSQPPVTMTKVQKLLLSLGVNPAVIGYDQDQDTFTSEELPYDGP